ncbi:hypothetical protein DJ68_16340 [Halorubrum sp. C3]|nr:hypothetical protein DJ68_16340 [Halorubrum sp. C3]
MLVRVCRPHTTFTWGAALSLSGFASISPYHPATGAGFAFIGLLVALDDVIEHMTPYSTPLDQVWKHILYPTLRKIEDG